MLNKVYAQSKQVSKYGVMVFFSSKAIVLTGCGFVLPCKPVVHLALPDHSMPVDVYCLAGFLMIKTWHAQSVALG